MYNKNLKLVSGFSIFSKKIVFFHWRGRKRHEITLKECPFVDSLNRTPVERPTGSITKAVDPDPVCLKKLWPRSGSSVGSGPDKDKKIYLQSASVSILLIYVDKSRNVEYSYLYFVQQFDVWILERKIKVHFIRSELDMVSFSVRTGIRIWSILTLSLTLFLGGGGGGVSIRIQIRCARI